MVKIIKVSGMKCSKCAATIKDKLAKIDGINKIDIDLEKKEVKIEYSMEVDFNSIYEKINDLGFTCIID